MCCCDVAGGLAKCYQFGLDSKKVNMKKMVELLQQLIHETGDIGTTHIYIHVCISHTLSAIYRLSCCCS